MKITHFKKFFSEQERESIQKHADHLEKQMHIFAVNQTIDDPHLDFQEAKNQFLILLWAERKYADHCEAVSQSNQNY